MQHRLSPLAVTGALAAVLLTGCSSDEPAETSSAPDSTSDNTTESARTPDRATEETSAAPPEEDATEGTGTAEGAALVETADSDLGTILVDGTGMTLYVFTQDPPGESVCIEECLEAWPILQGEPTAGDGVDSSLMSSFEREDGTVQATYADWPLYSYVDDFRPGDLAGQDVAEVWYVVSPEGGPITDVPAPSEG